MGNNYRNQTDGRLLAQNVPRKELTGGRIRISRLTRIDQKCLLCLARSSLWNCMPAFTGSSCKSKAVIFTAFCSSPVSFERLPVNVSEMRNSIIYISHYADAGMMNCNRFRTWRRHAWRRSFADLLSLLEAFFGGSSFTVNPGCTALTSQ